MATITQSWALPVPIAGDAWRGLHPDPVLADLLWRRGFRDATAVGSFLDPGVRAPETLLDAAERLPNLAVAVERGVRAIIDNEPIGIFGDYDADGTTAAAMLALFFRQTNGAERVSVRLPTRDTGYGLTEPDVEHFARHGGLLIVTDTGSTDHHHVPLATARGVDVVILDHHQIAPGDEGPAGAVTVSAYLLPETTPRDPLRDLTGAGLSWLYLVAIAAELDRPDLIALAASLQDLAMLGTVADVADLRGLNRALVRDGLRLVRTRPRPALVALCGAASLEPTTLTATDAAMKLAPRLNAAGRMGEPMLALDLLLAPDIDRAARLAHTLEQRNTRRKSEMNRVIEESDLVLLRDIGLPGGLSSDVLVALGDDWPGGVVGPAASRVVEKYGKPVILLCPDPSDPGVSRGSARSIAGFDIARALRSDAVQALLIRSGGHSAAAGLTIRTDRIRDLAEALERELDRSITDAAREKLGRPDLALDAELPGDRLTLDTAKLVSRLGPFGPGNENPLFFVRGIPVQRRTLMGKDPKRQHLKLFVGHRGQVPAEVILWGAGDRFNEAAAAGHVDLAVRIGINRWNGQTKLEAIAADFRLAR